jgi:hypothetical protein
VKVSGVMVAAVEEVVLKDHLTALLIGRKGEFR